MINQSKKIQILKKKKGIYKSLFFFQRTNKYTDQIINEINKCCHIGRYF